MRVFCLTLKVKRVEGETSVRSHYPRIWPNLNMFSAATTAVSLSTLLLNHGFRVFSQLVLLLQQRTPEWKRYICHHAWVKAVKNTFINPITIWGRSYNGKLHSLSNFQHIWLLPVSFFKAYLSLALSHAFIPILSSPTPLPRPEKKEMHLIMRKARLQN